MSDALCACGKVAVWTYAPKTGDYCEDCVYRGCSCNIDPVTGVEDTDEQGRLFPCCEYMWIGPTEEAGQAPGPDGSEQSR